MSPEALLDPARLERPDTVMQRTPFPFLLAHGQLPAEARHDLERDYPAYASAGFFPFDPADCGPSIVALVEQLTAPAFAQLIGAKLGIDGLDRYPTLASLCRRMNRRHGTIHTDSDSKVATVLLYLTPQWPDTSDGCFRLLSRPDDIDAVIAPEMPPLYGEMAAFKRCANSFHGHLPYEGERRVIQVAWLVSEDAKQRKTRRGRLARLLKRLTGKLDTRYGAERDRNAAHRD